MPKKQASAKGDSLSFSLSHEGSRNSIKCFLIREKSGSMEKASSVRNGQQIPSNKGLAFEIELLSVEKKETKESVR